MKDLNEMLESLNVSIEPTMENTLNVSNEYQKINLTDLQKALIYKFVKQLPSILSNETKAQAYTVKFADGLDHALAPLKNGGYMGAWRQASGQIGGMATLVPVDQALGFVDVMQVLSIATSTYYLENINNKLDKVSLKLDKILEFLYGDKRAELISEINFTQQIYKNYTSIMAHDEQKIATLIGLQSSRKVAVQDIEFYLSDLNQKSDNVKSVDDYQHIIKIKDCLDMSLQLYILSNILEIYVSQNLDEDFVTSVVDSMITYIDACERQMLNKYSELNGKLIALKGGIFKKSDNTMISNELDSIIKSINIGTTSPLKNQLKCLNKVNEYTINHKGDVYARISD